MTGYSASNTFPISTPCSKTFPNPSQTLPVPPNFHRPSSFSEAAFSRSSKSAKWPSVPPRGHAGRPGPRGASWADVRASLWTPARSGTHHPRTELPAPTKSYPPRARGPLPESRRTHSNTVRFENLASWETKPEDSGE
jgi:hypothetical protein